MNKKDMLKQNAKHRLVDLIKPWVTHFEDNLKIKKELYIRFKHFTGRILIISDLHAPWQRSDLLDYILENEKADLCIADGDLFDMYDLSMFVKEHKQTFNTELAFVDTIMEKFLDKFGMVVWVQSNHEKRMNKLIRRELPPEFANFVIDQIKILEKYQYNANFIELNDWWCQIGDLVVGHPDSFSYVQGRSVEWFIDWLLMRKLYKGEVKQPFTCTVMGHTHHLIDYFHKGIRGIECGCLCKCMDYVYSGHFRSGKKEKWYQGYAVVEMIDGKVDHNKTGYRYLDEEVIDLE